MEDIPKNEDENKLFVKEGMLYYGEKRVGESLNSPGFNQYVFDEEPLGNGANGITFSVTHKVLNVKQVVKVYFPKENENDLSKKAKEEAIKNANTSLAGITAVIFDAGEYCYPCRLWYSVMESVNSYCTIKQWRNKRDDYFPSNKKAFNINDTQCLSSIHTSINLAAGFLKSVISLYENKVVHGDLNPGNILWIFETTTIEESLKKYASYSYSVLGVLEPFYLRLIDMGASKANNIENAGEIRDSWKLFEHMKSFLSPLFQMKNTSFARWMNFNFLETKEYKEYGVDKIICVLKDNNAYFIHSKELAGDFFRLLCVLTLAFGIVTNDPSEKEKSIDLGVLDRNDFYVLMFEECIEDAIKAISFDSMMVLNKLSKISSCGRWINWDNVWNSYPLNRINILPVMNAKKENDSYM